MQPPAPNDIALAGGLDNPELQNKSVTPYAPNKLRRRQLAEVPNALTSRKEGLLYNKPADFRAQFANHNSYRLPLLCSQN